jgi:hypothetical protein
MRQYAYGITDCTWPVDWEIGGRRIGNLRYLDVGMLVSDYARGDCDASEENMRVHHEVNNRAFASCTVLPVRFGMVFASVEAVIEILVNHHEVINSSVAHVSGCVEIGVKVFGSLADVQERSAVDDIEWEPPSGRGAEYLYRRHQEIRREDALRGKARKAAQAIHEPLAALAHDSTMRVLRSRSILLDASYLVREDRMTEFEQRLTRIEMGISEKALYASGPWPPYSFCFSLNDSQDVLGGKNAGER